MTKKSDNTTIIVAAAATVITGLAAYAIYRTLNAVKKLEDFDLDFGNDPGLSSMFNRKDKM